MVVVRKEWRELLFVEVDCVNGNVCRDCECFY